MKIEDFDHLDDKALRDYINGSRIAFGDPDQLEKEEGTEEIGPFNDKPRKKKRKKLPSGNS